MLNNHNKTVTNITEHVQQKITMNGGKYSNNVLSHAPNAKLLTE